MTITEVIFLSCSTTLSIICLNQQYKITKLKIDNDFLSKKAELFENAYDEMYNKFINYFIRK